MPPLPAVANVLKIIIQGNTSETNPITWANVLHFRYSGTAPGKATCDAIATKVSDEWAAYMAAECPNPTVQNLVAVYDLTSSTSGSGADFTVNAGTRGDDEIPANAAGLIIYPVDRRYRGGHPRSYLLVGGNADFLDAAHWSDLFTAEFLAHWKSFLDNIIGYATGGTTITDLVNVSYYSKEENPVPPYRRAVPLVDTLSTTTMYSEQNMASQRRRIGRRRR